MKIKKVLGLIIFAVLVIVIIGIGYFNKTKGNGINLNLKNVYVATGGGKEDFIADEEVVKIMQKEYKLNVVYDSIFIIFTFPLKK